MSAFSISGFLCDSARQEADGKATIVGVWAGDIQPPTFPQLIACGAFARVTPPPQGVDVLIGIYLDERPLLEFPAMRASDAPIVASGLEPAMFIIADRFILQLAEPGVLSLRITVGDEESVCVARVRVTNSLGAADERAGN